MSGILETGGTVDNFFDVFRGELGRADTTIQAWFHDKLAQDTNRYNVQRVLFVYATGLKTGEYVQFDGVNNANIRTTLNYIQTKVAFDRDFIYNVLYALFDSSKDDLDCASVLAGSNGNVFDSLMNAGITNTVTGTVNEAFAGLGFPSLANSVIVLGAFSLVALVIYLKVKR